MERGANDSNWQPVKDAARQIAFAEDRAIFDGYAAAGIGGVRQGTSNPIKTLPADVREYPDAIAQGLGQLRLVGVNGPYAVLLGADAYTALAETSDHGYPVLQHVKRLVNDEIMENQVTVDDPEYLTKPWTWTWMYKRWPTYRIEEYVCEDNRYFEDPDQKYQRLKVN